MLRFGNTNRNPGILLLLFVLAFFCQKGLAQKNVKTPDAVRVDEKGRKFVNKIPYDVFFDDPLGIVTSNKDPVNSPAAPAPGSTTPTQPQPPRHRLAKWMALSGKIFCPSKSCRVS